MAETRRIKLTKRVGFSFKWTWEYNKVCLYIQLNSVY